VTPEEALELGQEILDALEDLPDAAEDFASSVQEKVEGIMAWINENQHVTENQSAALENMMAGVEKWQR